MCQQNCAAWRNKGGKPDPLGVLKLGLESDYVPSNDILNVALRGAMLRALVKKFSCPRLLRNAYPGVAADGHVFEITKHDIEQARPRSH